jgi:hypothetical protein
MRVFRSDSDVAHRLSLSARVLSAANSQVKAKRRPKATDERPLPIAESALHANSQSLSK